MILQANMVIGADGAESTVREQLQIPVERYDYQQSAIVTRTKLKRSHHHIAYERFTAQGTIAMLPLVDNECATIWTADNVVINKLMSMSSDVFLQELQKEFGYRLGQLQSISERFTYPLQMIYAEKSVSGCAMLLGNAAHTLHPVAAQGFNLALYDVAVLVEKIQEKLRNNENFLAKDLQLVSDNIQSRQASIIKTSHRLTRLFSSSGTTLGFILPLGMSSLNVITPIKKRFINMMTGRLGQVPNLLIS